MPGPVSLTNVDDVFASHELDADQAEAVAELRREAKLLAKAILALAPDCADRSMALRKLRECLMTANAAIALKGAV